MAEKKKKIVKQDMNQLAKSIVDRATSDKKHIAPGKKKKTS